MFQEKPWVLLLFALVLLAGCGSTEPPFECTDAIGCVDIAPGEPIKIGALQALSGNLSLQGAEHIRCTQLALDDWGGELLGHPIELQSADSRCSGEGGITAVLKIVADPQLVGLIGPTCSGAAASAMDIVSEAGLVMIAASCSAPSLTSESGTPGADWQPGFFRTAQNDALVGRSSATFAFQVLGVREAATIHDGDAYTRGLTGTFEQAFRELGGEVVLAATINKGDTDMRPVLSAVAASGAELVFFPVFRTEGDYLVLQSVEVEGMKDVTLMTAEGLYFDAFIQAVGEAGVGMYFTAPVRPEGPAYEAFLSRYETKYGEAPAHTPYHAHTVDAVNLLLSALESVAMHERDGTLHIGRQALRDALHATAAYEGLTGSLTCDDYGDCGVARFKVVRLDDPAAGFAALEANVVYAYPPEP